MGAPGAVNRINMMCVLWVWQVGDGQCAATPSSLTQGVQCKDLWLIFNAMNSRHGKADRDATFQQQKNKKTNAEVT